MRGKYVLGILCCLFAVLNVVAQSEVMTSLVFKSRLLGQSVRFSIYLPDGYKTSLRSYPVLYLLHGWGGNETSWLKSGDMKRITDQAIASGKAVDMIVVMPDGRKTWYVDKKDGLQYESMFFQEFIPYIEKNYRARSSCEYRAVAGLSMGGYGALLYALHHPGCFSACAPLSGAFFSPEKVKDQLFDKISLDVGKKGTDYRRNNDIMYLACHGDMEELGQVRFYFDCGEDDPFLNGNFLVHRIFRAKNIPHEFRINDGRHNWPYWREALPKVLEFVSRRFLRS